MDQRKIKQVGKNIYTAWKVFVWVLRWLSIVLFGVLFFVGVYFRLPWKVLACIAVIPVVGIFVPRKIQPWVWGGLTVMILSLWGWVHLPERDSDKWKPYEYYQELLEIKRDHLQRDIENAAEQYEAIFSEHGETIFDFIFRSTEAEVETRTAPWDPQVYPFLDFWISEFDPALQQLIKASQIEQCRFDIPYNLASMEPQMRRIHDIKGWTQLMIRSAFRDLFRGNRQQALEKMMAIVGMAQHLYQQQTLFDQAGAFHIELAGARALETFIIDQCDDHNLLMQIEQSFLEIDPQWPKNWPDILAREKLTAKNLAALMYEVNKSGKVRISHNAMMALQAGLGYYPRRLFINQHVMNRIAVIGLWLSLPMSPQRLAEMVDERFDHYSLRVQKGDRLPRYGPQYIWLTGLNAQSVIDWLAMQKVGYFWALDGQFERHQAIVNQIRIFTALKQYFLEHQRWPKELNDLNMSDTALNDPLCGKPFVYEQTERSFRLYSLGPNGIDDGGLNNLKEEKDDILLWPRSGFREDVDVEPIVPRPRAD
jgi:hypothetical protein